MVQQEISIKLGPKGNFRKSASEKLLTDININLLCFSNTLSSSPHQTCNPEVLTTSSHKNKIVPWFIDIAQFEPSAVPEISYLSSKDEEFFDNDDDNSKNQYFWSFLATAQYFI